MERIEVSTDSELGRVTTQVNGANAALAQQVLFGQGKPCTLTLTERPDGTREISYSGPDSSISEAMAYLSRSERRSRFPVENAIAYSLMGLLILGTASLITTKIVGAIYEPNQSSIQRR